MNHDAPEKSVDLVEQLQRDLEEAPLKATNQQPQQSPDRNMANPQPIPKGEMYAAPRFNVVAANDDATSTFRNLCACCGNVCGCLATWVCCICCDPPYKRINQGTVGIKMSFGKVTALFAPGLYFVNPCTEKLIVVDKRERVVDVREQHVVSKDNVTSIIDACVYIKIQNAYKSVFMVSDVIRAVQEISITSLRDIVGKITLQELLEEREKVADLLYELMAPSCAQWGVEIRRTLIQEIKFTESLKKSLSTAATAIRLAESKVINAQADVRAAKLMKDVSEILSTEAAMQIRYLEAVNQISKTANAKVVFYPSDYSQIGSEGLQSMGRGTRM